MIHIELHTSNYCLYKCVYTLFDTIFCDMVTSNIDTYVSVDVILITLFALDQESQK